MITTVISFFKGKAARAEADFVDRNAALLLEQKIREAEAGHDQGKRALASIIVRKRTEEKALAALSARITDIETRTRDALSAGKEELATEAAKLLAELENERATREDAIARAEHASDRLRLATEKAQRRITDLKTRLITARNVDAERSALRKVRGSLNGSAALAEGEQLLRGILDRTDPVEELEVFERIEAELSGEELVNRLAEAGFGDAPRIRPVDVLDRLRAETRSERAAASA